MKINILKTVLALVIFTLHISSVLGQSPEKMSYQAVIRDASNDLIMNQSIGIQFSILQGSASGTTVYIETQTPTTNANGLVSIKIGTGTTSDDFATIDWANGPYFIKTETDPTGGTNYSITGISQLLSVPYALHAKTAETVSGGITETDPVYTTSEAVNISASDITNLSNLSGTNTGDQDISGIAINEIAISTIQNKLTTQDTAIELNTSKIGISTAQANAIIANTGKDTAGIFHENRTALNAVSGTNTGDQDLSSLASKTALGDSIAKVRSEIPDVPTGNKTGEMQYWDGSAWITVSAGNEGQVLTFTGGVPTWKTQLEDGEIENPTTGKIWMDRNLGALQVATSSTDTAAYGDLYQWGRGTDGHEKRTSNTTYALSSTDNPGHGDFITLDISPYDWRSSQNDNLWQGVGGTNNPCPIGYRLPTEAEWEAERISWGSNDAAGAFASPLKLTVAGYRRFSDGSLDTVGSIGRYWSSTVDGTFSQALFLFDSVAIIRSRGRANGRSVRCIKD